MRHVCDCGTDEVLASVGPLVQLILLPHPTVRDSFIAAGNMPEVLVRFMVDTGADRTVVEQRVAESMGLSPVRFAPMVGVSQEIEMCPVYLMTVRLSVEDEHHKGIMDFATEVIGMKTPKVPRQYVGLLGRDFLRGLHVNYNGPKGRVELHLSSQITGKKAVKAPKSHRRR